MNMNENMNKPAMTLSELRASTPNRTPTYNDPSQIPDEKLTEFASAKRTVMRSQQLPENLRPIDPFAEVGTRKNEDDFANSQFAALDLAIEREKVKIDTLIDDTIEQMNDEVFEAGYEFTSDGDINKVEMNFEEEVPEYNNTEFNFDEIIEEKEDEVVEEPEYIVENRSDMDDISDLMEDEPIVEGPEVINVVAPTRKVNTTPVEDISEEDEDDDIILDASGNPTDKQIQDFKNQLKDVVKAKTPINLNKFTIKKTPVSISKLMSLTGATSNVADWVMYSASKSVSCSALKGVEITKLNPNESNRSQLNTARDIYRIIYDHVVDANKPDFESWMKTTRYNDVEHLYFALYRATFDGSNYISYSCPNSDCNHVFIKDVTFESMVKFDSDEAKAKVKSILAHDSTTLSRTYEAELVQISDKYVVGICVPSIWSTDIERASLPEDFVRKYADTIGIFSWIDAIYYIDYSNNELVPVDLKPVPNDQSKTTYNKIRIFNNIINQLDSDEYNNLFAYVTNLANNENEITYQNPEAVCPKCGTAIPAEVTDPAAMLFIRHQLGAYGLI